MKYSPLGKTGERISLLSLGTEYLIDTPRKNIEQVVGTALDAGVDYIDLFFAQPELRENIGRAVAKRRASVKIAGHLGAAEKKGQYWKTRNPEIAEHYFDELLLRLKTDYVDVLFLHNCDKENDYKKLMDDLLPLALKFKKQGKARLIGFSNHVPGLALSAVKSGVVDLLMYPVNMADTRTADLEMLQECAKLNVPVVAMKVFGGGKLLIKERTGVTVTPHQCIQYALSQPGVVSALPGPKNVRELKSSLAFLGAPEKKREFARVLKKLKPDVKGQCVYCNHCLPCPAEMDIGGIIRKWHVTRKAVKGAFKCTRCGACTLRCPFGVDVVAVMDEIRKNGPAH